MQKHETVGTVYYNPKLVSCPTCNAPEGEPCIGLVAPGCGPHLERYYKARAFLNHPSNQPAPHRYDSQLLCKCWFCQQTGTQFELGETNTPRVPPSTRCGIDQKIQSLTS